MFLTGEDDIICPDSLRDGDEDESPPNLSVMLANPLVGSVLKQHLFTLTLGRGFNNGRMAIGASSDVTETIDTYLDNSSFIGAKVIFGNVPLALPWPLEVYSSDVLIRLYKDNK